MMRKVRIFIFFLCCFHCAFAQNPLVKQWDKRFGGTNTDYLYSFQQTSDGGFILGGSSVSGTGGDKTQATWGIYDYWIVKTDSLGTKQWDKDFGGIDNDQLYSVQQTSDGGFILGGYSSSGIGGDKIQATWGTWDYWIVKTDSLGNMQWNKDFGGTAYDYLYSIQQTSDGGFILGGCSGSGIGGDKTQATWGNGDYWIVKTDSLGNKQWDKDFGGFDTEFLLSLQQTDDGGYILGGYSNSGANGDKTQGIWGLNDYWIVKLDSIGNKIWDKDFGGTGNEELNSLSQTFDKGYITGGYSGSGISGDKSEALLDTNPSFGARDLWLLKTDSLGNKTWDKKFGGLNTEDDLGNIIQTNDMGYLAAGTSYSNISGDKSENNLGREQSWIIKTDSLGNKQWDKTIHTDCGLTDDELALVIQTNECCFVIAGFTWAGIGGDKTQASRGGLDYWMIKFCDTSSYLPIASLLASNPLCSGSCTGFINQSTYATTYFWSFPGATPPTSSDVNPQNICYANPGNYDVQLIASNTNGSDTLFLSNYITVYQVPPAQAITQIGDTLFAIAGAAAYQWYFNSNIIAGATAYFYVAPLSGDYNVVATDVTGCEVEAAILNVMADVQLEAGNWKMTIFPNPVNDNLQIINLETETAIDISIYNLLGEKVYSVVVCRLFAQANSSYGGWTVDCRLFSPGMYWLEINSDNKIFRTKFVKSSHW